MHGRLLTNQMRLFRNLTDSDICQRCQGYTEDMSHLLRGCIKAKSVWLNLQNLSWWQEEHMKALPVWLQLNMISPSKMVGLPWATIFLTTIWHIWKDRNKEVLEHHIQPASIVTTQILQQAKQIQEAF